MSPNAASAIRVVPFVAQLAQHGERVAVITPDVSLSYAELAMWVGDAARRLGPERRLVLVEGGNDLDSLVWYLGALAAGQAVLLVPGGNSAMSQPVVDAYDPDVLVRAGGSSADGSRPTPGRRRYAPTFGRRSRVAAPPPSGRRRYAPMLGRRSRVAAPPPWRLDESRLDERRAVTRHDLHPDLALLLSTSGSTGSPKLVRLSYDNLQSNAASIAEFLDIRHTDRAATTLPMHYCYGLSVIHSHLFRGAGIVLTDLSVVDACFWDLAREVEVTTLAGVPHTFDLLDRVGFAEMSLPSLRYITQAGGRMAPEHVRRFAELGQRRGFDLVVMYGATEATARMAYLPPERAVTHPGTIGVPIPGGGFSIEPVAEVDEPGGGELVYHGRNVMLGYAQTAADLGLGRGVTALRTGDLARRTSAGHYEIIGRRSRFVKIVGLRIDLQQVERMLASGGHSALCAGADGELAVVVESGAAHPAPIAADLAGRYGLPQAAVHVAVSPELPRLANGKPDYPAVRALAAAAAVRTDPEPPSAAQVDVPTLTQLYSDLLGRGDVTPDSTFVDLGGDSLSYVEMSVQLEQVLGHLPPGWHTTRIRDLAHLVRPKRRFSLHTLETSVAMRAAAIIMIVGSHIGVLNLRGGAHALLAVAGYNFARFQLTSADRRARIRSQLASIARVVVPSVAFIAVLFAVTSKYTVANVFLVNNVFGPDSWATTWQFWFVEVLVQLLVLMMALLAIPWVDRLERSYQFGFALGLLGVGVVLRFGIIEIGLTKTAPALWLFAFGWALARASSRWHRVLLSAVVLASVPGFFDSTWRNSVIIALLLLLTWAPTVLVPAALRHVAGVLAGASLYIYLVHWVVYPAVREYSGWLAVVASLLAGIGYWLLASRVLPVAVRMWRARRPGL